MICRYHKNYTFYWQLANCSAAFFHFTDIDTIIISGYIFDCKSSKCAFLFYVIFSAFSYLGFLQEPTGLYGRNWNFTLEGCCFLLCNFNIFQFSFKGYLWFWNKRIINTLLSIAFIIFKNLIIKASNINNKIQKEIITKWAFIRLDHSNCLLIAVTSSLLDNVNKMPESKNI